MAGSNEGNAMSRQSLSGVSIDEEAAQVLQFQRSFQASAQMISAVNQMMQSALAITGF